LENQINPKILYCEQFLRASNYDPLWILDNSMGCNVLWLTDFLTQPLDLKPGMRVLDLGCGKGISSVFLAREFGVQVYAVDLWESADGKWEQAKAHGVDHLVTPIQADARNLPFAKGFFDAVLCVDAYIYFGTDDLYLNYITQFLRPNGKIGMIVPGLMKDFANGVPEHLQNFWGQDCWCWHTLPWWKQLWERTSLVTIDTADILENGCALYARWKEAQDTVGKNPWPQDTEILKKDVGEYVGFIRLVATKN